MKMSFDVASKVSRKLLDNFLSKFPEIFKLKTLLILMEIPSPGSPPLFLTQAGGLLWAELCPFFLTAVLRFSEAVF